MSALLDALLDAPRLADCERHDQADGDADRASRPGAKPHDDYPAYGQSLLVTELPEDVDLSEADLQVDPVPAMRVAGVL